MLLSEVTFGSGNRTPTNCPITWKEWMRLACTNARTHTHARTHARTHTCTHAHTLTNARTHTHTHTHTRAAPPTQLKSICSDLATDLSADSLCQHHCTCTAQNSTSANLATGVYSWQCKFQWQDQYKKSFRPRNARPEFYLLHVISHTRPPARLPLQEEEAVGRL